MGRVMSKKLKWSGVTKVQQLADDSCQLILVR